MTATLPLRARDGSVQAHATIDAADAVWAGQWRWHLDCGYAKRTVQEGKKKRTVVLHRDVLGLVPGDGLEGDHIDRDRLNNTRSNLRILTKRTNPQNKPSRRGGTSRHRRVSWNERRGKWIAQICIDGTVMYLGGFVDELDAAEAARAARARLMPYAVD